LNFNCTVDYDTITDYIYHTPDFHDSFKTYTQYIAGQCKIVSSVGQLLEFHYEGKKLFSESIPKKSVLQNQVNVLENAKVQEQTLSIFDFV